MDLLTLYSGLLLPWFAGTLWLIFAESQLAHSTRPNRFRQVGYGFFLGYAVLFLAIMSANKLTGSVSWPGLMWFFLALSVGGGIAIRFVRRPASLTKSSGHMPSSAALKAFTVLLLIWMGIHFLFFTVEIFTQPLFPWDAWTVWAYRAKAWFLSGGITEVVSPASWLTATSTDTFTSAAWSYPLLPSIITYWTALSLGAWSETLINLPTLFLGMAMGMALFGQCRESGFSVTTSLLCCYMLYSIPLFGNHIALAGYADIWLAGFTGLGFVALLRALSMDKTDGSVALQLVLGLVMTGLAILVKYEGMIWFLTALAMLTLLKSRPRILLWLTLAVSVALIVCIFLVVALDINSVRIPLIGILRYADGQLTIPFIGQVTLEAHNIWGSYLKNFFIMGNWNLLWVLVLASMVLSVPFQQRPAQRTGLVFLGIFVITQLFIFGLTKQGLWAKDFTAINRLPLHFVPALLFAAFIILRARFDQFAITKPSKTVQATDV